eukprot:357859-Chlamydomonas_euryale.AAC.12
MPPFLPLHAAAAATLLSRPSEQERTHMHASCVDARLERRPPPHTHTHCVDMREAALTLGPPWYAPPSCVDMQEAAPTGGPLGMPPPYCVNVREAALTCGPHGMPPPSPLRRHAGSSTHLGLQGNSGSRSAYLISFGTSTLP